MQLICDTSWHNCLFLSLLPPSCMVVPIGESVNISFFNSSSNMIPPWNTILPTVDQVNNTGMDILKGQASNNYNEVRGRMLLLKSNIFRNTSMSFVIYAEPYHKRMTQNNDMDINNNNNKDTSPELSYKTSQEKVNHLSIVAEKQANTSHQWQQFSMCSR